MFTKDTLQPTACKGKRFIRRRDLTPYIRLSIAYTALYGAWGEITQLAEDFMISRTFVYMLMKDLKQIAETVFGECKTYLKESVKEKAIALILLSSACWAMQHYLDIADTEKTRDFKVLLGRIR